MSNYINKIIEESLAIEAEEAKEAGALGFMARSLVQATLPHRNPKKDTQAWGRENGYFSLVIQPGYFKKDDEYISLGFPYGNIPRLLLAWMTTEAVRTKDKTLILGNSLSEFMRKLDLMPTGGRWGSITRLREQMQRLLAAKITCTYNDQKSLGIQNISIADQAILWWTPQKPEQAGLWESLIELSDKFFNDIINHPVPIDMRALKALKQSPMALDIYCWLTYRMSYLKQKTQIPWEVLQIQFGSDYAKTRKGKYSFKENFIKQLRAVLVVYPQAKIECDRQNIILKPGKPHILQKSCE